MDHENRLPGRSSDAAVLVIHFDKVIGRHLLAKRDFRRGEFVMEFIGSQMTTREAALKRTEDSFGGQLMSYQFHLTPDVVLDGWPTGNLAPFANSSHVPNMKMKSIIVGDTWRLFFVATREINESNALTVDYGAEYVDNAGRFVECTCNQSSCTGIISINTLAGVGRIFKRSPDLMPRSGSGSYAVEMELNRRIAEKDHQIRLLEEKLEEANAKIQEEVNVRSRKEKGSPESVLHDVVSKYRSIRHEERSISCPLCKNWTKKTDVNGGSAVQHAVEHFITCAKDGKVIADMFVAEEKMKISHPGMGFSHTTKRTTKLLERKGWKKLVADAVNAS